MLENMHARLQRQQIGDDFIASMPALNQRGVRARFHQRVGGAFHIINAVNIAPRQQAGLGQVRRHQQGEVDQKRLQRVHRIILQQLVARCGHYDRVNQHGQLRGKLIARLGHRFYHLARRQHAGLHHIGTDIAENGGHLTDHKGGGHGAYILHAQRVLRGQSRNSGGGISALRHNGFNIGLNPRAAARVRPRDNQNFT